MELYRGSRRSTVAVAVVGPPATGTAGQRTPVGTRSHLGKSRKDVASHSKDAGQDETIASSREQGKPTQKKQRTRRGWRRRRRRFWRLVSCRCGLLPEEVEGRRRRRRRRRRVRSSFGGLFRLPRPVPPCSPSTPCLPGLPWCPEHSAAPQHLSFHLNHAKVTATSSSSLQLPLH